MAINRVWLIRTRNSSIFYYLAICVAVFLCFSIFRVDLGIDQRIREKYMLYHNFEYQHDIIVSEFYEKRKNWNTSMLGSILFQREDYPVLSQEKRNETFVILIWKRWKFLQKRHLYYFGKTRHDPLNECSVKNCIFTGNDSYLNTADAVMIHLHAGLIPETTSRNPRQKWIFLDDESPKNSFGSARKDPVKREKLRLSNLANVFNWSMTYRSDADIPVPYGRVVALEGPILSTQQSISEIVPNWKIKRRDVLATILISNCAVSYRKELLKALKKQMTVHVHGKCGDKELRNSCPGHFKADCKEMSKYLFYIVLENSKCKEYITEKIFYHAYSRGAIPIIQGPSVDDCERLLPPNSFLHFDNYATLEHLAKDLIKISEDEKRLLSYHMWRNHFYALNEHGYFGSKSYHFCRLCEAMNYNDKNITVYSENDLKKFLDVKALCRN